MNNKTLLALLAAATLSVSALPALAAAPTTATVAQAGTMTNTKPAVKGKRGNEKHPAMRAAWRHLRAAKNNLTKAKHDFGGHRAKALELTNQAIAEIEAGLKADKK